MVSVGVPLSLALSAEAADFWEEFGDNNESPEPWLTELLIKNFDASEHKRLRTSSSAISDGLKYETAVFSEPRLGIGDIWQ